MAEKNCLGGKLQKDLFYYLTKQRVISTCLNFVKQFTVP
jgi:hypothetical protein